MKGLFEKLFGGSIRSDRLVEPVILVPVPSLVALLLNLEREKGVALTEIEVLKIRDDAVCIAMSLSVRDEITAKRGYDDINPERVWDEWVEIRPSLLAEGN